MLNVLDRLSRNPLALLLAILVLMFALSLLVAKVDGIDANENAVADAQG